MTQVLIRCHISHREFYRLTPSEVLELIEAYKIDKGIVDKEETTVYKDPETIEEEIEARLQCDRMAGTLRSMCKK